MKILYTSEQIRELEQAAIAAGRPGIELMRTAAMAAMDVIQREYPRARRLCIYAGPGNNGGDGYALAALAKSYDYEVQLITLSHLDQLKGDARTAAEDALYQRISPIRFNPQFEIEADLIIDALLGIGLTRPVEGAFAQAIEHMNKSGLPILALDIPSGLDADTGRVMGTAVKANVTLTFVGRKLGLYTGAGPDHVGQIFFADLDIPQEIYQQFNSHHRVLDLDELRAHLPQRPHQSHKNHYGNLLIVGGDYDYPGAIMLTAMAAARVGTGLIRVITRKKHTLDIVHKVPEVMAYSDKRLEQMAQKSNVIAIGPGLGEHQWGRFLFEKAIYYELPMVIDASALYWLAQLPQKRDNWILTPHPGEAAILLGTTPQEVEADRYKAVAAIQKKYGGVVVLKGAGTLISNGKETNICHYGNPGMASAGMGDVLTGVIAGLYAQGIGAMHAAETGVLLHARAGDQVAQRNGMRGLMASDLMPVIQKDLG